MNAVAGFLNTRRGMTIAGWALLFVALWWPTPWGAKGSEGQAVSSGLYAFANLMRPEEFPDSAYGFLPRSLVIGVAFFTNLLFLFGVWFRDNAAPSRAFLGFLIGAVVVDLAVAFILRDFARMPGYWIWVAAVAAIMWAFVARPATGQAPPGYAKAQLIAVRGRSEGRTGLPDIVWVWIGWAVFWIAISGLAHWVTPEAAKAPDEVASRPVKATALAGYVNDFAGVLRLDTVERLGASLAKFEKETSTQVAVALYAQLPDVPVEEFTINVAELSRLGRKGLDNGAILSVFAKDKVARVEVGYGLEGTLTDAQSHRILESVLAPAWNGGDREKAVEETLSAVMASVRDDFQAGRMPGRLAVFWRQLTVEVPRFAKALLPILVAIPTDGRFGISFFGTFLLLGIWDGFVQTLQVARNLFIAVRNLRAGKPLSAGTQSIRFGSIIDTLKVALFFGFIAYVLVGIVVIAGGGAFGSAGATLHW
ncbi:MAG: TPM domain-containing protein [Betaproteobacteria bacterium]|nr:TPM domain-containing protein [Betaproteobacteria bacterium]